MLSRPPVTEDLIGYLLATHSCRLSASTAIIYLLINRSTPICWQWPSLSLLTAGIADSDVLLHSCPKPDTGTGDLGCMFVSFDPALQSPVCRGDSVPEVTKPTTMSSCQPQRHLCPLSAICARAARTAECPFLSIRAPLNVCAFPGTQSWLPHSGPMQMCGTPKGQSPEPTGLRCLVPEVLPIPDPTLVYVESTAAWEGPQLPEQRPQTI